MLTVLTPSYNRRHTLPRLHASLQAQPGGGFEWLVVDDGSTDGTAEWVRSLPVGDFSIRLIEQANGGKHVALNTGVAAARGDWVFIVDSDDVLTEDAVEVVATAVEAAGRTGRDVAGLCFRKADLDGRLLGREWRAEVVPLVGTPTRVGRLVDGDLAYAWRRDIMVQLPFPVIRGEKFVPELYIWNKLADLGEVWFYLDRVVTLCEYLDDGYTRNFGEHLRRNPRGFLLFYAAQIAREPWWVGKLKALVRSAQCMLYCVRRAYRRERG